MAVVAEPAAPTTPTGLTDRAKAERKLAWTLCAPAVIVMLLVAGFPIIYAFWLSLHRADLRFPAADKWVGFHNYIAVLTASTWWKAVGIAAVVSVIAEATQLFSTSRFPSATDVTAALGGTAFGALASSLLTAMFSRTGHNASPAD